MRSRGETRKLLLTGTGMKATRRLIVTGIGMKVTRLVVTEMGMKVTKSPVRELQGVLEVTVPSSLRRSGPSINSFQR